MQKIQIAFLILPHVHLMDLAGPDQVFLEAIGYDAPFTLVYSSTEEAIQSSAGLPFGTLPHYSLLQLNAGDYLFIPGASLQYIRSTAFRCDKKLFAWIRSMHHAGINICSICSGAFVLAEAGLLDGRNCTTHWKRTKELQQWYPAAKVIENVLFVQQDNVYTSAGIASGIDMALHIVEQVQDAYFAHKVARELVIYNRRSGNEKQKSELLDFRNHIHAGIHAVQDWLHENLHKKVALEDLAAIANMSTRNFTRIFKKETGLTVNEYVNLLRREKISLLQKNPDLTRRQIAKQCGLKSERHVTRLLHAS